MKFHAAQTAIIKVMATAQHKIQQERDTLGIRFYKMVSLEKPHAARSGIRVAAVVRKVEIGLLVAIRSLRMIERKK